MLNNDKKVIYYKDELNDEFAGDSIKARPIDEAYWYGDSSLFFKVMRLFWYRIFAFPLAVFYMKVKYHHKIVNRSLIYPYKNKRLSVKTHSLPLLIK